MSSSIHTEPGASEASVDLAALQRRTLNSLRLSQIPGQAAVAASVAVVTLLASDMLGSDRWAGLGGASMTIGAAVAAVPLATVMRRRGRRPGLTAAFALAAVGALLAGAAGQFSLFWLLVLGMFVFGSGQAAVLQSRYVATDLAPENGRARAVAAIVWVGTLGAVVGPLVTPWSKRLARSIGLEELVGPYLVGLVLFVIAAAVVWWRLRPDPLRVIGGIDPAAAPGNPLVHVRTSLGQIGRSPLALLGLTVMAGSQAAMVAVMTMTPPHMKDHGHADLSAVVIAVHIFGMFGLAPIIGRLVDRLGAVRSAQWGAVVLGCGTVLSVVAGYVPVLMFTGLFLLGVGWSIGLISGTTLLTSGVSEQARVPAQGTSDLMMSLCGAVAAFGSGFVKASVGFHILADAATVLAGMMLVYAWYIGARQRRGLLH
jgi:MFS family permease